MQLSKHALGTVSTRAAAGRNELCDRFAESVPRVSSGPPRSTGAGRVCHQPSGRARLARTALATTALRDARRQPTAPPPAPAASHVPYRAVRRPPDRLARSHHRASRARASPRPPHHRRQPWARNRHATHARTPAALAVPLAPPGTASTHAGAASDACGPRSSLLLSLAQEAGGSGGRV